MVARCTVERLMRALGPQGAVRARKCRTTIAYDLHKLDALNRREAVAIALSAGFITAASSRTAGPSNGEYVAS